MKILKFNFNLVILHEELYYLIDKKSVGAL